MKVHPLMNIRFPESKEAELLHAMRNRANAPWQWQEHDAFGRPPEEGQFYFHRDEVSDDLACTLYIRRNDPGNFVVGAIIPDADTTPDLAVEQYVRILREFDALIAEPAAVGLGGMTSIDTAERRLEDYFSAEAIQLLQRFCTTSSGYGSHLSDQEKWMDFLVHVHRTKADVHCDVFGECLKAKNWWPEDGIPRLVSEYDFAMRLLQQSDRPIARSS